MQMVRFQVFITVALVWLSSVAAAMEGLSPEQLDYFETHVRPALVKYCYECHSVDAGESRGGLYLDTREAMREGGSSGPIFDEEKPEWSLFVDAITWADRDYEMPPKEKMPEDVIDALVKWVEMGAPDPREREVYVAESTIDIEAGKSHWAYQMPVRPAERSIDALVEAKRREAELKPVAAADPLSLLRRLTFDLTGLPPTPPEVKAFYRDYKADPAAAYQKKVEQLLASPQYGERWGRHWLDVVRFAESSGTLNIVYPYAWRFRNYVIDSFNEDKPYDQLITEHLAGDLLPAADDQQRQKNLIATGYLALGPKKQNEKNRQVFRMNLIDEQIDTTTRGFMATTVACARCHDHKFDPIATTDYYAMAGIFSSTETLWGTVAGNQNHRTSELLPLPIADAGMSREDQGNLYEETQAKLKELVARNNYLRGRPSNTGLGNKGSQKGTKGKGKGKGTGGGGKASPEERQALMEQEGIEKKDLVRLKQQILRTQSALSFLNPDGSAKTFAMGAREGSVGDANVLISGDINKPAQQVERGFVEVIEVADAPSIASGASGRLELAEWITSEHNPLTSRVMVNRIWMHLTGKPIVETMDNFGFTGLPPTNPELLDYLAIRFVENDWSIKAMIREIVHSDTYQLASTYDETSYATDPANETHWRANVRQLDAEALRDQMLVVSGQLERQRPDTSIAHELGNSRLGRGQDAVSPDSFDTSTFRGRSLYLPVLRDALPDELGLFDFPDPQGTVGQRTPTNVAPQSLHLMNSDLLHVNSVAMAKVLEKNFTSLRDQVSNAYLLSYSRPATANEITMGVKFVQSFDPGDLPAPEPVAESASVGKGKGKSKGGKGKGRKGKGKGRTNPEPEAEKVEETLSAQQVKLTAFCQALMMSAEFRTIH